MIVLSPYELKIPIAFSLKLSAYLSAIDIKKRGMKRKVEYFFDFFLSSKTHDML